MIEKPLTPAESDELAALRDAEYTHEGYARYWTLFERALLYGEERVEARPFEGLAPRYRKR